MKSQKGYTLIELVTAMAVGVILTGLAVDLYSDQIPRRELKAAGQRLVGEFRLARQKAIADGTPTKIIFSPQLNQYNHPTLGLQTLPPHVRFGTPNGLKEASITFSGREIATFNPSGTISAGHIYLINSRQEAVAIRINFTGRVRQERWDGNAWQK